MALALAVTAAVSAAVSSLVTYQVAYRKLGKEFDERLEAEKLASAEFLRAEKKRIRDAKISFGKTEDAKPATPEHLEVAKIDYTRYAKISENDVLPMPENPDEVPDANVDEIYEISVDDYMANETEFEQHQISWFKDGMVVDSDGDILPDYIDRIGNAEPPFGGLSGEEHVAYIRNTRRREEYEVTRELMTAEEAYASDVDLSGGSST